jgi:hypothetical protein
MIISLSKYRLFFYIDGRIKGKDSDGNELTVASVYRFITASKIVPRERNDKLAYKFVLSKKKS